MSGSVLIIDGDAVFAESVQAALEAAGIGVHLRHDGGVDTVRELRPHVVMVNLELPKGSGFSICNRIRTDKILKDTPILLTSAEHAQRSALEAHASTPNRANDYLLKPTPVPEIVARLQKLLESAPEPPAARPPEDRGVSAPDLGPGGLKIDLEGIPNRSGASRPSPPARPLAGASGAGRPADGPPRPPGPPARPGIPSAATQAGPPPLRKLDPLPNPQGAQISDLWPQDRFEEVMRASAAGGEAELATKARASPEDRINALRQLVKAHESRDKQVKETWAQIDERGQELARRVLSLSAESQTRGEQIAHLARELEGAQGQGSKVETEFRAFEAQVRAIGSDFDAQDAERRRVIGELEATQMGLNAQLAEATEKNSDNDRRIQLLQEELDVLQIAKDHAEEQLATTAQSLAAAEELGQDLKARLEMTQNVANEAGAEVNNLRDRLDQLALESRTERQQVEGEYQNKLESQAIEHASEIDGIQNEHSTVLAAMVARSSADLEAVNQRHADLLESLNETSEAELAAVKGDLDSAQAQIGQQSSTIEELEAQLEESRREIADLNSSRKSLEERVRKLNSAEAEQQRFRAALEVDVANLKGQLEAERATVSELEISLEQERIDRSLAEERGKTLEEHLESTQSKLFERNAETDHLKKTGKALEARANELENNLRATDKSWKAGDAKLKELSAELQQVRTEEGKLRQEVEMLEKAHTRLEEKIRENNEMLESEREKKARAEDQFRQTKVELDKQLRQLGQLTGQLDAERAAREDVETRLEMEKAERASAEGELESERAERAETERSLTDESGARSRIENDLEVERTSRAALEKELAATKTGLEKERRVRASVEAQLETERGGRGQIDQQLKGERGKRGDLEAQLGQEKLRRADLEERLQAEQGSRSELEVILETETEARTQAEHKVAELGRMLGVKDSELASAYAAKSTIERQIEAQSRGKSEESRHLQTRVTEAQSKLVGLEKELRNATAQADASRTEAEQLRTQLATMAQAGTKTKSAEHEAKSLAASEKALMQQVANQEEELEQIRAERGMAKVTLVGAERDVKIQLASADAKTKEVLTKVARALASSLAVLSDEDDEPTGDEIPEFTGEVEPLDLTEPKPAPRAPSLIKAKLPVAPPPPVKLPPPPAATMRSASPKLPLKAPPKLPPPLPSPSQKPGVAPARRGPPNKPPPPPPKDNADEPFAALVAELQKVADGDDSPFNENFAAEVTANNGVGGSLRNPAGYTAPEEQEEGERSVTEIINLDKL